MVINTYFNLVRIRSSPGAFKLSQEFLKLLLDITEKAVLILKAIRVAVRIWGKKKKGHGVISFMLFGDSLLKHVASIVMDAL